MNIVELLAKKTGKGIKTAAKDTGKALEIAGKTVAKEIPTVAAVGAAIPSPASPVFATVETVASLFRPSPSKELLFGRSLDTLLHTSLLGDEMNPLETFGITMVLGILQSVVKNPAHKAALQHQLVGVADQIYMTYGMVPPTPAPAPTGNEDVSAASH